MTILGVSLGSRTTGVAIIKDSELLVARSVTLRNKATKTHTAMLSSYITQYQIATAVIKMPPPTHITRRLKEVLRQCLALFQYHGCMVEYNDTRFIKERLPELANKKAVMRFASTTYPALIPLHQKELANKQKYHLKMFEAVVVAHLKKQ